MVRSSCYALEELDGRFFLFPIGQACADFARDVEINEVGAFIWGYLKEAHELDEIVDACMKEYECDSTDYGDVKQSVEQFVTDMEVKHLLYAGDIGKQDSEAYYREYSVADIDIRVFGGDEIDLSMMSPFVKKSEQSRAVIQVYLEKGKKADAEEGRVSLLSGKRPISQSNDVIIYRIFSGYQVLFSGYQFVSNLQVSTDGSTCIIGYNDEAEDKAVLSEEIFNSLKIPFYLCAQKLGRVALHSASVVYKDKGWIFSGKTHAGKSTHANLWNRYLGTKIFNGDVNLLGIENGLLYMYGIPWCGTSGLNAIGKYPVGGIMFIKQNDTSRIAELPYAERVLKLLRRLFTPFWCEEQADMNTKICKDVANVTNICELFCTKEKDAFDVSREYADRIV